MAVELKQLIFDSFENNLKYIDNNGKEVNPLNDSDKAYDKAKILANELGDAIIKWVEDQKFTITNSEQSVLTKSKTLPVITPTGPGSVTIPPEIITTSQKNQKKGSSSSNPKAAVESTNSVVQLINTSGNRKVK